MRGPWQFVREMRRRHVFRTAAIYIVGAWVLLEVIALAFQSFGIPETALQYIWLAAIAGFPLALIFGWRYDITPEGIVRTPPAGVTDTTDLSLRKPDYIVLTALAVIAVIFVGSTINEIRQGPLRGAGPWFAVGRLVTAIAVLPLENLSGDTSQEFLSAGLHDALITTLSRITRFRVTSRFSSRRVNAELSFPQIGRLLGVDKILSGSVLREGDQVRVNVTLVDAETEQPLWTESFTREFDGLISMQNEVASAVAREVKVQLTPDEERQLAATDGPDSATYEAYLRGMFQLHKGSPRGYRCAIKIFTEAVENDPTSALAYAGLAIGYAQLGHSPFPAAGAYPRAKAAAQRALELNPDYPVAWLALGQTYLDMGRIDEAIEAHEHLRNNRFWGFVLATTLAVANRDEDAEAVLRFVEEGNNNPFTLALIYGGLGDREQTMKWLQAAKEQKIPWFPWQVTWYPHTKFLHDDPRMQQFAAELGIEFPD